MSRGLVAVGYGRSVESRLDGQVDEEHQEPKRTEQSLDEVCDLLREIREELRV